MTTWQEATEKQKRGEPLTPADTRALWGRVFDTGGKAMLWIGITGLIVCYLLGWRP